MPRPAPDRILTQDPQHHPAAASWVRLGPERKMPGRVELLKKKAAGEVYRLFGAGPGGSSVIAKRCRLRKGRVERLVFEEVLPHARVSHLRLLGYVERKTDCWLFLEDAGEQLYAPRSETHRRLAMRWLARLHAAAAAMPLADRLPRLDASHYLDYLRSILREVPHVQASFSLDTSQSAILDEIVHRCRLLESRWDSIEAFTRDLGCTLVHGDCLAKNVHVRETVAGPDVAFFDWGGAGWGLPGTDLGQLEVPRHVGSTTRRDHATYAELVRQRWPELDATTVGWLSSLGQTFWSLKVIRRELEAFEGRWATIEETTRNLRFYSDVLGAALPPQGLDR